MRFPALYRALAESGASVLTDTVGLHPQDRRGALACAAARPRHRDRLLRDRRRASWPSREQARDLRSFADRRALGRNARRWRRRTRRVPGRDRPFEGRDGAQDRAVAAARTALHDGRSQAGPEYLHWRGDRHDPVHARLRPRPQLRKLVPDLRGLRCAGEAELVSCPVCDCVKVEKAIMAPRIVGKKGRERTEPVPAPTPAPTAAPATRRRPRVRHR